MEVYKTRQRGEFKMRERGMVDLLWGAPAETRGHEEAEDKTELHAKKTTYEEQLPMVKEEKTRVRQGMVDEWLLGGKRGQKQI